MALHPNFPSNPYEILDPAVRWIPGDEEMRIVGRYDALVPPLVPKLRELVADWRTKEYEGATETSKTLLKWWFGTEHLVFDREGIQSQFRYYFAQREAMETIVYLTDIVQAKDKHDLMRFDSSGAVSANMFMEEWRRWVVKMATGSGKTKVMSLVLAWSYFHKTYEESSNLARNFLIIAPNIIVLDRLRTDFEGLKIFFSDPILPENGHEGRNWRDDFQLTLHLQDEIGTVRSTGNIFLTNIHRVYQGDDDLSSSEDQDSSDHFLGPKVVGKTNESKIHLDQIVRDIDELVVLNDEAHHIHDERLAWFKSIQDIHNKLVQKGDKLALQVDFTATPKHNNGAIFVQTITDYPLVEAIAQNIVKHPILPDVASQQILQDRNSSKFSEKYADFLHLGYEEWKKYWDEQKHLKKPILFIMTDDTRNCDEVAEYMETHYPEELSGAVLTIHTKDNGEVSEAQQGKNKDELEKLRKLANTIDSPDSPYKCIVSVLMLKEGWDVRNVTTIIGLRPFAAPSNILPEQTLGRGLRKMYGGDVPETVSVVGTPAFMEFVESIKGEGVKLERAPMGPGTEKYGPILIEIDREDVTKDIDNLDIKIPVLTPRIYRNDKNLENLDISKFEFRPIEYRQYDDQERRIVFESFIDGEPHHEVILELGYPADYRSVLTFFTNGIKRKLRLVSGYDVVYEKMKDFVGNHLFGRVVDLESEDTIKNLSEIDVRNTIINTFETEINKATVAMVDEAKIVKSIFASKSRPFTMKLQEYYQPRKSVFNRIVGDSHFELEFAAWLDRCPDVVSFVKNYFALNFKIDYQRDNGEISNYYPDFVVKISEKEYWVVETKGWEDVDVQPKLNRLAQWCDDVNNAQNETRFNWLYVKQEDFNSLDAKSFGDLCRVLVKKS